MPAPVIPQLRASLAIDATNDSFLYNGNVITITQGDYLTLFVVATAMEAAVLAALGLVCTISYNATGALRGHWTIAAPVAFALDDNAESLMGLFGFPSSQLPVAGLLSYDGDDISDYVYTPEYPLRETDPLLPGGYAGDEYMMEAVQTVSMTGVVQTTALGDPIWVRTLTFCLLLRADILWLRRFWAIVYDGRRIRFLQDRTIGAPYDETSAPFGYLDIVMDIEAIRKHARVKFKGTDYFEITFIVRQYVS